MKTTLRILTYLAAGCLVLGLMGCSAGNVQGPATDVSSAATAQVATALFVQQWGQVLWGMLTSQTATGTPSFEPPTDPNPDGSVSQTYTGPDGTTVVMTAMLDGTLHLDITFPDGTTQNAIQGVVGFDGVSKITIPWEITSSDGMRVTYASIIDNQTTPENWMDDTTTIEGNATLAQGLTQQFTVVSTMDRSRVRSEQSDGSVFQMSVPLDPFTASPDLSDPDLKPTTGTYTIPGARIDFTLASTTAAPTRWGVMNSDVGGDLAGVFALRPDFAGSGEMRQGADLAGALSWTRLGDMSLRLVSAEQPEVSAAGASVDFLTHRWQTLAALFAPGVGAAAVGPASILKGRPSTLARIAGTNWGGQTAQLRLRGSLAPGSTRDPAP